MFGENDVKSIMSLHGEEDHVRLFFVKQNQIYKNRLKFLCKILKYHRFKYKILFGFI